MYLQVWNGIEINSTTFGRTVEWRGGVPCLRENFPPETFAHENYGQGFNVNTHITQCILYHPGPSYPKTNFQASTWHCPADEFQCNNGSCLPWEWICDGKHDCPPLELDRHNSSRYLSGSDIKCAKSFTRGSSGRKVKRESLKIIRKTNGS